ncbi:MAG TPA: cbb3-type cytochrome oxidase assembly protein CcoS [Edaphocola sp.]|nr:cbb3-type cytochrome oxidase assembly protein CcoS [Edaphocola sp.]
MGVVIFLLCVSLIVALVFLLSFIWGVKSGQFEDDYSPAHRIFFEDKIENKNEVKSNKNK